MDHADGARASSSVDGASRVTSEDETASAGLMAAVERFLAGASADSRGAYRALQAHFKTAKEAGRFADLAQALRLAAIPMLDFTSAQSLCRMYKALPQPEPASARLKLAILGGFTTHQLRDLVELFLFAAGIDVEIYESDYGVFRQEIFDPASGLSDFSPDVVFLATHWRNLGHQPGLSASPQDVEDLIEAEYRDWAQLWATLHERFKCQVVQNNFDTPPWRALGNYEMRHPATQSRFIAECNRRLMERAPPYVAIHDVEALAATAGRREWANERFYLHAKMPCAPEYLVDYAHSVASILTAQRGLGKKCLVLDLDNTLWGGVIGDDGMDGIRIGQGDAESEAFASFQRYVKALAARGVILAVCSKNTDAIAREVFESHPGMVLRMDDVSCFAANWTDKAANLRQIAKTLNIGLDSLVFIDDNPAERSIIRQLVPEVSVPELSTDPIDFIEALERHRYFQVATLGTEDFKRTEYYRANTARMEVAASAGGIEDYLKSLDMVSRIEPITSLSLERSTQLINKSNQFNLTTRRKTSADLLEAMNDEGWVTKTVTLTDRFGDNGLISVVLAEQQDDTLNIDTWLMSCRVLKRGVEHLLLNDLVETARARGLRYIRGEYIPTAKNALVRDLLSDLGFDKIEAGPDGHTIWQLSVNDFEPLHHHIKKV